MQKMISVMVPLQGITPEQPDWEYAPVIDELLEDGCRVVHIVSHGFHPNSNSVVLTIIIEKEDINKGARFSRSTR